jgi:hypothetical protein
MEGDPKLNVACMFDEGTEGTLITSDNLNSLYDQGLDSLGRVDVQIYSTLTSAKEAARRAELFEGTIGRTSVGRTSEGAGVVVTWHPKAAFEFTLTDFRDPDLCREHEVQNRGSWELDMKQCRDMEASAVDRTLLNGQDMRRSLFVNAISDLCGHFPREDRNDAMVDLQLEAQEMTGAFVTPTGVSVDDIHTAAEGRSDFDHLIENFDDDEIHKAIQVATKTLGKHRDGVSTSDTIDEVARILEAKFQTKIMLQMAQK